ncbi:M14 family zinc carboxypeptidase [uncultured Tenacibaculum sp.]|uniref:M14 family zinc carboxypeptidase n=1 Tax=uncultured Tenacibaculum sp. TaxID=174713 RepID=UPI00261C0554|nr:M14 family zinc carboxypeptidase [uncultured Tenacibaculum sp.]
MNTNITRSILEEIYPKIKEDKLFGKWITLSDVEPLIQLLNKEIFKIELLGESEEKRNIYKLKLGTGTKKIMIWSQMHGNESTGTKALFDLFKFFETYPDHHITKTILSNCSITIIPMLNPDGSLAYTRVNAKEVDLNRDAVDLEACESILLRNTLDKFNPKFCFNLHDQRTIFGVEGKNQPATISFLAPSEEETRKITAGRKETMNVIIAMNELLQTIIPNQVGRYTDEFYPTATGDNFQKLGHNTILIEAGHYKDDYNREEVRKFNFYALLKGLYYISSTEDFSEHEAYFEIPNNNKQFFDVIHRHNDKDDVAYQYEDKIIDNQFVSTLKKHQEGNLKGHIGHNEIVFEY